MHQHFSAQHVWISTELTVHHLVCSAWRRRSECAGCAAIVSSALILDAATAVLLDGTEDPSLSCCNRQRYVTKVGDSRQHAIAT